MKTLKTVYFTLLYVALCLSIMANYAMYNGILSVEHGGQQVAASDDYLTTLADARPVNLIQPSKKKGK